MCKLYQTPNIRFFKQCRYRNFPDTQPSIYNWSVRVQCTCNKDSLHFHRESWKTSFFPNGNMDKILFTIFTGHKTAELKDKASAATRIRTWVIAATKQCTNHYTITAAIHVAPNYYRFNCVEIRCTPAKKFFIALSHAQHQFQEDFRYKIRNKSKERHNLTNSSTLSFTIDRAM